MKWDRRGRKRGPTLRPKGLKNACGMCGKKIKWKKTGWEKQPFPFNIDGTPHFMSCNYVSAKRKKAYGIQLQLRAEPKETTAVLSA